MKIFIDSDVVISSLLSSKGAAHMLLYNDDTKPIISSYSEKELTIVVNRLGIDTKSLTQLLKTRCSMVELAATMQSIKASYKAYVVDPDDAHIVAGAHKASARFLITYNIKHYHAPKLKEDFNIILITPGQFLQYLRSLQ